MVLQGLPGTGKSVVSGQIAFEFARRGLDVLFVSLLSESHGKLIQQLGGFRFYDERLMGTRITLVNGYDSAASGGTQALLEMVASIANEKRPALIIIDGFGTLRALDSSPLEIMRFTHRLNAIGTNLDCVTLLLDTGIPHPPPVEHALVDGVLDLGLAAFGARRVRQIEVTKMRSSSPLTGSHLFEINGDGVSVYPRLETLVERRLQPSAESRRKVPFGLPDLDAMLRGGVPGGSTTLVIGQPGSGKTLLGLQFLEQGLQTGERCVYFGFHESPERLVGKARAVGMRLEGNLTIEWHPPLERALDDLGLRALRAVNGPLPCRLVIDGIEGFQQCAARKERLPLFLTALSTDLRARGLDVIYTAEQALPHVPHPSPPIVLSTIVENVIHLRYVERERRVRRLMAILKMRESEYDSALREFRIDAGGIQVSPG